WNFASSSLISSFLRLSAGDNSDSCKSAAGHSSNRNLLLLEGVLKNFAPLEKLAGMLQIDRLKSISVKELRNYIEFANGKVMVKPFNLKIDEIEMLISGFHGFYNSIDYAIQMKLPRSVIGAKGNELVTSLASKISSTGLPFKLSETINLSITMKGTVSNPLIGINLKGMVDDVVKDMEQQAKDFLKAKLDSAKQKTKDSLVAIKDHLLDKLKDNLKDKIFGKDTTKQVNNPPPDSTQNKPPIKEKITNKLKDLFLRPKKPKDSL
ncbi:MAG: AsmA-like C-terminal region-containing protein, partial [Ferruginibacter sp.]